jgi:hypothetical protein
MSALLTSPRVYNKFVIPSEHREPRDLLFLLAQSRIFAPTAHFTVQKAGMSTELNVL